MTTTAASQAGQVVAGRPPLSALAALTAATLVGGAATLVYAQAGLVHEFRLDLTIFAGLELISAALIAGVPVGRWRWTPLLGTLFAALTLALNSGPIIYDLSNPSSFHPFAFMAVAVSLALVMLVAGLAATVQNYARPAGARRAPRGLATALVAVATFVAGAVAVAAIPQQGGTGVSPETLAGLPAMVSPGFVFEPGELRVRSGEMVAMRLDNPHGAPHSFDIDALGVHVAMPSGESALALFQAPAPGTYEFYCAVPGHREAGMVGTMIVE
ncbi:MAG TPA: cupredoxin domain-containing protein [Chloroflexaceae bacterium]|nr:cupredoxin domain-containing protein [Chloroflexaceae bacterium]